VVKRAGGGRVLETAAGAMRVERPLSAPDAKRLAKRFGVEIAKAGEAALPAYSALWRVGSMGKRMLRKLPGAVDSSLWNKNTPVPFGDLIRVTMAAKSREQGRTLDPEPVVAKLKKQEALPVWVKTKAGTPVAQMSRAELEKAGVISDTDAEIMRVRENFENDTGVRLPEGARLRKPNGKPVRKLTGEQRKRSDEFINSFFRRLSRGPNGFSVEDTRKAHGDVRGHSFLESTRGVIRLALDTSDAVWTAGHESIHLLRQGNMFTDEAWAMLSRQAERQWMKEHDVERRYPELTKEQQIEEAIAEGFGQWLEKQSLPGLPGMAHRVFWELHRILRVLARRLFDMNVFHWTDWFDAVADGRVTQDMTLGQDPGTRTTKHLGRLGKSIALDGEVFHARMVALPERDGTIPSTALLQRAAAVMFRMARNLQRVSAAPLDRLYAHWHSIYRKLLATHEWAMNRTGAALRDVIRDLTTAEVASLSYIARALDADEGYRKNLPVRSGMSAEEAAREATLAREMMENNPRLKEAYKRYQENGRKILKLLIQHELAPPYLLDTEHFFHRMVLEHMGEDRADLRGRGSGLSPGRQLRREGSEKAISNSLVDSFTRWGYVSHRQIARSSLLKEFRTSKYQIKERAAAVAEQINLRRTREALEERPDSELVKKYEREDSRVMDGTLVLRRLLEVDLSGQRAQEVPPHLRRVFETFMAGKEGEAENRRLDRLGLVRWIAEYKTPQGQNALLGEATVRTADELFDAILERRKTMKGILDQDYIDPHDGKHIVESLSKGLEEHPDLNLMLPPGLALRDFTSVTVDTTHGGRNKLFVQVHDVEMHAALGEAARKMLRQDPSVDEHGIPRFMEHAVDYFGDNQVRLVEGTVKDWMLVPKPIAEDLNAEVMKGTNENFILRMAETATSHWKGFTLLNPSRVLAYNLMNMSGDFEAAFVADPSLIATQEGRRHLAAAWKELWGVHFDGKEGSAQYLTAVRGGEINSGHVHSELEADRFKDSFTEGDEKTDLDIANALHPNPQGNITEAQVRRVWKVLSGKKFENMTTFRENWLRLALGMKKREELRALRNSATVAQGDIQGAVKALKLDQSFTNPEMLAGMPSPEEAVALFVRSTFIDYQYTSRFAMSARRSAIPFIGWVHGQFARYANLSRNMVRLTVQERSMAGPAAAAKLGGMILARSMLFYSVLNAWNMMMRETADCGKEADPRPMVLVWCSEGNQIGVRTPGALADLLSWANLDDWGDVGLLYRNITSGRMTTADALLSMGEAGTSKAVSMATPGKVGVELLFNATLWPSVGDPRPIEGDFLRGKGRHLFKSFLGTAPTNLYDMVTGTPVSVGAGVKAKGNVAFLASLLGAYRSSPEEIAYNYIRSLAYDFRDSVVPDSGGTRTVGEYGFWVRQFARARKFGNVKLALEIRRRLVTLERERARATGKPMKDVNKSIRTAIDNLHPTKALQEPFKTRFLRSLSPTERRYYRDAMRYYKTLGGTL